MVGQAPTLSGGYWWMFRIFLGFQISECLTESCGFVGTDLANEVYEGGGAASGLVGLLKRVNHEACYQLFTFMDGQVAVRSVVSLLDYQMLLR